MIQTHIIILTLILSLAFIGNQCQKCRHERAELIKRLEQMIDDEVDQYYEVELNQEVA